MNVNTIYTGSKFFNKKIFIESFNDKELDAALKSVFHNHYHKTAPLRMARADVQLLLNSDKPVKEQRQDHIMPEFKGGQTILNNIQLACRKCNRSKGY